MIVTRSWLNDFVDFDLSPEELSHRLTMAGLEVDFMEKLGEGLDSVIVARLASVGAHPEADRLTVCQVETGIDTIQVVCGATNHKTGDLIALAQVGSVLPGDFKIKKSKIRGQVSFGMLCSEKELALSAESEGIMILPEGLEPGTPVFEALGLKDVRYDIGLTPNRADCLSVAGVAREVSAMVGEELRMPEVALEEGGAAVSEETSVTVEEGDLCPRYAARLIRGVKIGPSPDWLVRRLESIGQRSVNNVVDVTNYVLMELGHPLHAFDFNLLAGRRIVVKKAAEGETFTTLDGQERLLASSDLVICDGEGAVALAGIMGGGNSEVSDETVDVLLESAYFNPIAIRRTAKRLGIHSESSHRFERGADVDMVPLALDRAAALILEVAGGTLAEGRIDVYPSPLPEKKLCLSAARTEEVLGLKIELLEIQKMLRSIGLAAELAIDSPVDLLDVTVPCFRPDLEREIDLIEEVARLNGYDRIPVTMPVSEAICQSLPRHRALMDSVRESMVAAGFSEVVNYSFVSPGAWDRIGLAEGDRRRVNVKVLNPLTEEQSVMRTSLVPSLLDTVTRNLAYRSRDLRLFELRPVFEVGAEELPVEKLRLTAVLCGRREPEGWAQGGESLDFFDLKGVVEDLLAGFNVEKVAWNGTLTEPFLHPGKSCTLESGKVLIGTLGEVHPRVLEEFEADLPLYLLDLDLEAFFSVAGSHPGFKPLSRFPDVYRDSAFLVDESVSAARLLEVVSKVKGKHVEDVVLFDEYRGKGVSEGKKSLAIRVRYRSSEKTLTDEEIGKTHGKIVQALVRNLEAEIR